MENRSTQPSRAGLRNLLPCQPVARAGLRLAIADDAGDDQVRVVERGPVGVAQGVAEFSALVDAAGSLRATWLGMPPGKLNCLNSRFIPSASWLMFG